MIIIKKIICYFIGHKFSCNNPYKIIIDDDGFSKVGVDRTLKCNRCSGIFIRQLELYELMFLVKGMAKL